jgi:4-methylaminobutanoate oxidase (formaldehyde-forming)
VKLHSGVDFKGREAVRSQREGGLVKMLATFTAAPGIILSGRETIYRNGERCGWLSSGGFGHFVNKSIGMGYVRHGEGVDREYVTSGDYELEVAGQLVPARVTLDPLYDPKMERVKA